MAMQLKVAIPLRLPLMIVGLTLKLPSGETESKEHAGVQ